MSSYSEPTTDITIKETDNIYAQFDSFLNTIRCNAIISTKRYKKKRKREDSKLDRFLELSLENLETSIRTSLSLSGEILARGCFTPLLSSPLSFLRY